MKEEVDLPPSAQTAFESYPTLEPSAAFNRAVLQELARAQHQRRTTLVGRIEEFLGLDLWRFAASGMLGAFIPALILGALYISNRSNEPVNPASKAPIPPFPSFQSTSPIYAREWEYLPDYQPVTKSAPTASQVTPSPQGGEISCVDSLSHLA